MHASNVTFYQYEGRALNHGWLHNCAGFHALRHGASDRFIQEQGLTHSLRHSAHRVRDPSRAQLFYVPIWTVTSAVVGACNGTTHAGRMAAARAALLASPWWLRFYGRDHVWSNGRPQHVDRDLGAITRRRAALALHRADVLYDLRDSRAGDHFLAEVAEHCLPNLLPELAAENGWNRTALPAAPRLPASCGRAAAIARKLAPHHSY